MATISISGVGFTGCFFEIDGLSYPWDTDQYNYAYAVFNSLTTPSIYPPPPVGANYNTPSTLYSSLSSGTVYTAIGYLVTPSGTYATSNSYTFTTATSRPSDFSWSTSKVSGANFNLTGSDWNALATRINDFRIYKSLSTYGFTTVSSGQDFAAYLFNQAVTAISAMSPPTSPPSTVSTGMDIYASYLNGLVSSLNSIS